MTLNAKLVLLMVALAGAAAEATTAFAVMHAVPRPAALGSIRPVHQLFRRGAHPTLCGRLAHYHPACASDSHAHMSARARDWLCTERIQ